jgi:hypothetical protein
MNESRKNNENRIENANSKKEENANRKIIKVKKAEKENNIFKSELRPSSLKPW